jgi:nitrile hydratase
MNHDHPHDHVHDHDDGHAPGRPHRHPHQPDEPPPTGHYQVMATALHELMVEKGLVTADEIRAQMERMDARGPHLGARVIAKAWSDPAFKARLLADPPQACAELGIDLDGMRLTVMEDEPQLHNVIVCTLCSCYPRALLGLPPAWYKSADYRKRAVREPRTVLKEFGTALPDAVELRVHDSTAELRYIVLPLRPAGTEGWSEEKLASLVTRDTMIGVTLPKIS